MMGWATAQPPQPAGFDLVGSIGQVLSFGKSIPFLSLHFMIGFVGTTA